MKNLEQIRAASALQYAESGGDFGGQEGGEVVKKLPAMIMTNGLLAAAAFAADKGRGWKGCFDHLTRHLAHADVQVLDGKTRDLQGLLQELTHGDSALLKLATSEALAWLSYAGRFVKTNKGGKDDSQSR